MRAVVVRHSVGRSSAAKVELLVPFGRVRGQVAGKLGNTYGCQTDEKRRVKVEGVVDHPFCSQEHRGGDAEHMLYLAR